MHKVQLYQKTGFFPGEIMATNDTDLSRIGVSLPKSLLDKFDDILTLRGYSSRSEGIRDAIRSYISYYQWMSDVQGDRQGVITMVYDHEQRGLLQTLTDIQHDSMDVIQSNLHSHVNQGKPENEKIGFYPAPTPSTFANASLISSEDGFISALKSLMSCFFFGACVLRDSIQMS